MRRIIFTTEEGIIFNSPFVYDLSKESLDQKFKRLKKLRDDNLELKLFKGTFTSAEVFEWPEEAVYPGEQNVTKEKVLIVERAWRQYYLKKEHQIKKGEI